MSTRTPAASLAAATSEVSAAAVASTRGAANT